MPLFSTTVVLADLAAVVPDWHALEALPPAELEAALTERYRFLHPEVRIAVEGGPRASTPPPPRPPMTRRYAP